MGLRSLIAPVALATVAAAAAVLPASAPDSILSDKSSSSDPEPAGFVSFPIHRAKRTTSSLSRRGPELQRRDADVPLFNISATSYLIKLSIGTPGQTVKVAIDTGSDELWVDPVCSTDSTLDSAQKDECTADGRYTASSSSTSSTTNVSTTATNTIPYGIGEVEIKYVADTVALPGSSATMKSVQFGVAQASQQLNEGIMGLAYGNGKNTDYNNFVDELAVQGVTQARSFTVALGSVDANNGGVIIFGGIDTKKFSGSLIHNTILGPQFNGDIHRYYVQLKSIGLTRSGSSKTYPNSDAAIVIDSGSSFSYLPDAVFNAMVSDFGATEDQSSGIWFVDCSERTKGGSINFAFSGGTIQVPVANFIWEIDSSDCALGALSAGDTSSVSGGGGGGGSSTTTFLLGDTFMRSVVIVFDQTNNDIAMAPFANCGQNEQALPASGVGNLTGECSGESATAASGSGSSSSAAALGRRSAGAIWYGLGAMVVALLPGAVMAF